ncbi:MAG: phage tail protein, partial [bacterium]
MGAGALLGAALGAGAAAAAGKAIATGAMIGFSVGRSYDNYKKAKEFEESVNQSKKSQTYSFGPISNTKSHQIPIPIVYGKNLVAGNIINQKIYGEDDRYMDIQVGLSEGPIESISEIKADEKDISADVKLGEREQSPWSENEHEQTFPYLAYISTTLDAEELESSGTPTITSIIKGRKVRVWEDDRWENKYSNNPAFCLLDFLTNNRYGLGINDEYIDLESFREMAEYCDEEVDGEKRFELDIVIDQEKSALDWITEILSAFKGFLFYSNGKLKLKIDKPEDPVQEFAMNDEVDNIISGSFSRKEKSRKDRFSEVTVKYTDPAQNYEQIGARFTDESLTFENKTDITILGINRFSQAGREARYFQRKSSLCTTMATWGAGIDSIHCEVGDVVLLSHDNPGWEEKPFRVMEISEQENDEMQITAIEYNEAIYSDHGVVFQESYGSELANPFEAPPEVENLKSSEYGYQTRDGNHVANIIVNFDIPNDERFSHARIEVSENEGSYRNRGTTENDDYELQNVRVGSKYKIRVRTVSKYRNIKSAGVESNSLLVTGKDNKPAAPEELHVAQKGAKVIFQWEEVNEPDILGYEIRKGEDWENGELIGTKLTGDRWTSENEIDGTHRYMIKSI